MMEKRGRRGRYEEGGSPTGVKIASHVPGDSVDLIWFPHRAQHLGSSLVHSALKLASLDREMMTIFPFLCYLDGEKEEESREFYSPRKKLIRSSSRASLKLIADTGTDIFEYYSRSIRNTQYVIYDYAIYIRILNIEKENLYILYIYIVYIYIYLYI